MQLGRCLIVVILAYITLDLSLASMPGAFVFDAGDSVESVQTSRTRDMANVTWAPAPICDPHALVSEQHVPIRRSFVPVPLRSLRSVSTNDKGATPTPDPTSSSEDPH